MFLKRVYHLPPNILACNIPHTNSPPLLFRSWVIPPPSRGRGNHTTTHKKSDLTVAFVLLSLDGHRRLSGEIVDDTCCRLHLLHNAAQGMVADLLGPVRPMGGDEIVFRLPPITILLSLRACISKTTSYWYPKIVMPLATRHSPYH